MAVALATGAGAIGAWLNLVGPASTAVTKIIELSSNIPAVANFFSGADPSGVSGVVVNVGIGMFEGGDQDNFGGDGLKVSGFTSQGTYTADGKFQHMSQGTTSGLSLGKSTSPQVWQLTIAAGGTDAVCVQYVELAWQGTLTSGFDGTWGRDCNQDWYYSQSTWGTVDGFPYRPDCFWFDSGSNSKHPLQEMWVDMEKLVSGAPVTGSNSSAQTYCNDQVMKFSSTTNDDKKSPSVPDGLSQDKEGSGPAPGLAALDNSQPKPQRKRGQPHHPHLPGEKRDSAIQVAASGVDRPLHAESASPVTTESGSFKSADGKTSAKEDVLVVSDIEAHSAEDLCGSSRSRGPDFVSHHEKKFCDMKTKTTHPLCEGSAQTDCFALDHVEKKIRRRGAAGTQDEGVHRSYKKVTAWTSKDTSTADSADAQTIPKARRSGRVAIRLMSELEDTIELLRRWG